MNRPQSSGLFSGTEYDAKLCRDSFLGKSFTSFHRVIPGGVNCRRARVVLENTGNPFVFAAQNSFNVGQNVSTDID